MKGKAGAAPPEPIKPSFQAKELLETLEFNEVDMYRLVKISTLWKRNDCKTLFQQK